MQKFRLCFPLDDEGRDYLIPELLSKREPELEGEFPAATSLCFTYQYDTVLPEGLLPRFIVETYVQRETQHAWKTGVVLERANCRALVRGDLQARKIMIRVTGPGGGRRELLGIVREHFERIHQSFTKLPVTELVPVPGFPEVVMKYWDLLAYEHAEVAEVMPIIEDRPVKFLVKDLLDGVDVSGLQRDTTLTAIGSNPPELLLKKPISFQERLRVFISYSHQDQRHLARFRTELDLRERLGQMAIWADPLIEGGQDWNEEIFTNLKQADIFILLLSPESVASKFVMEEELPRAEALRKEGKCEIVPILIRPCGWEKLDLARVQTIRPDGKAVSQARNRDVAWQQVMEELDKVIARIREKKG